MLKIVVCDNDIMMQDKMVDIINNYLIPSSIEYKIVKLNNYAKASEYIKNNDEVNIYFLDVELGDGSGIDLAAEIRGADDWKSIIVMVSSYESLQFRLFSKRLLIYDFINKFDNLEENVKACIEQSCEIMNKNSTLRLMCGSNLYHINTAKILYVVRNTDTSTTSVYTLDRVYETNTALIKIQKELGIGFKYSHRKCVVNVSKIDFVGPDTITFKDGTTVDYITNKHRKDLV